MKRSFGLRVAAALLLLFAVRSLVFVDEIEFRIVTQFGRPVRTLKEAGLHFKLPYQSSITVDRRLQLYDPRPSEFLAAEKKNIDLDVYVCWRVADPKAFYEAVADKLGAEAALHDVVFSELAAQIGKTPLEALLTTDPSQHRLEQVVEAVLKRSAKRSAEFGIEIVDVGIKRISQPAQIRDSVFQRMRAERARLARKYRAEGEEQATKIKAQADKERAVALAQAYASAERTRGEAEAEATKIYAEAHGKDPQLYRLLRTLEAYKTMFDDKTTLLLSGDSELFEFLSRFTEKTAPPESK